MERAPGTTQIASVLLDQALDQPLDYLIPQHLQDTLLPGMRVEVPLRKQVRHGTVLSLKEKSPFSKLAPLLGLLHDTPFIQEDLFKLCQWISQYYCCPLRKVLKAALPPSVRGKLRHKEQLFVTPLLSANELAKTCEALRRSHSAQAKILDHLLKAPKGILLSELLEFEGTSRSSINTLVKNKVLSLQKLRIDRAPFSSEDYFKSSAKTLSLEQQTALNAIQKDLNSNTFTPRLIFGVTGSGKTEIYLQAIEHALSLAKKVLFLVPEIALTSQTVERLYSRFDTQVALLHHRLSPGEKHDTWHHILKGDVSIVVGARSSVFVPLKPLGLIIIDEEHDSSYKQSDESPTYHARDVALIRAKFCHATVLMGSATPALESYTNALSGKYALSILKERPTKALLPSISLVDMRRNQDKNKGFTLFSDLLLDKIKTRLKLGEQTLLFLNRRGYHSAHMCKKCGHIMTCPECDLSLTYHLSSKTLSCHLCGYTLHPLPRSCPSCHSTDDLKFKGFGTEMVESALHALLPEVRTLRLDADTTKHKGSHEKLFKQFKAGKADVLIGTQMIAKGLHFPSVTLVGILNADSTLQIPDFRASEQMFQLSTQVAGRAGRAHLPGEVVIQTFMPEHPAIQLALSQDFTKFYAEEIAIRKEFGYPPFTHLVKLTASGADLEKTEQHLGKIRDFLITLLPTTAEILPIIPCGYARIKGKYRFQCLIKSKDRISPLFDKVLATFPPDKHISLAIDVDPLTTFF